MNATSSLFFSTEYPQQFPAFHVANFPFDRRLFPFGNTTMNHSRSDFWINQ